MKKAIIVGASSGIGRGVARLLAEEGYSVGITGRRLELLNELKASKPGSFIVKSFDINNYDTVLRNLDELAQELGDVDLFLLCSGIGKRNRDLILECEINTLNTNVIGFTYVIHWAFKYFERKGRGNLAAITSITGVRGFALSPSYSSSKAFQIRYLEALRQKSQSEKMNIKITEIRAGFVDTDMGNGDGAFWIASVEKAAKQIYSALKKDGGIFYVSRIWRLVSFFLKIVPGALYERVKL